MNVVDPRTLLTTKVQNSWVAYIIVWVIAWFYSQEKLSQAITLLNDYQEGKLGPEITDKQVIIIQY